MQEDLLASILGCGALGCYISGLTTLLEKRAPRTPALLQAECECPPWTPRAGKGRLAKPCPDS